MTVAGLHSVRVWDLFVRCAHWALLLACVLAWFSHGGLPTTHRMAGYAAAGLVSARIAWGFVGSHHARFASFVPLSLQLPAYAGAMLRGRERRFVDPRNRRGRSGRCWHTLPGYMSDSGTRPRPEHHT